MKRVPDATITAHYRRLEQQAGGPREADAQRLLLRVARDLGVDVDRARRVVLEDMNNWGAG